MRKKGKSISNLKQCRDKLKRVEGGVTRQKYELLAEAYEYALGISQDSDGFAELASDEFFAARRKSLKQEDALRLSFVFLLEAEDGPLYDRACTYARALQPSFREERDPAEIPDMIEQAGGIEKLYRDVVAREKREAMGLQIEATSEELDEVLATDVGSETQLRIKRLENGKAGWIRFGIVAIEADF